MSTATDGPFKDIFGKALAERLAAGFAAHEPGFDGKGFVRTVSKRIEPLELMDRVRVFAEEMRAFLPDEFTRACEVVVASLPEPVVAEDGEVGSHFALLPLATFVELHGQDDFATSMAALKEITQRATAEFALRPFLLADQDRTLKELRRWVKDTSPHVRRAASEATRPRLPWGMRLQPFVADPEPVIALISPLKDDPVPYVHRSVANNLNDIAKDHPDRVLDLAEAWADDATPQRRWLIRHGLRTLVKKGEPRALALMGIDTAAKIEVARLTLSRKRLKFGETLAFAVTLTNREKRPVAALVDFALHFPNAKGGHGRKVFKLKQLQLDAGATVEIAKRQPMRAVTTRANRPGRHLLDIQVNGRVLAEAGFDVSAA